MTDKTADNGTLFIGAGVELKGNVEVPGAASVDGKFEGTLKAKNLLVGQTGHVSGQISVETAEIRGTVDDNLTVMSRLVLRATGSISGKISYSKIMVEEGGTLSGTIEMIASPKAAAEPESRILQLHQGAE